MFYRTTTTRDRKLPNSQMPQIGTYVYLKHLDMMLNHVAYNQQKFISHSSGVCKALVRVPALSDSGENALPGCRLLTSHHLFLI